MQPVTILSAALSLALLAAMAAPGIAILARFARWLTPLEQFAYGSVLGIVVGTLAMLPVAIAIGFTPLALAAISVVAVALAIALHFGPGGPARWHRATDDPERSLGERILLWASRLDPWATGLFVILIVRWALLWSSALTIQPDGLWAGHEVIWSDWPTHIGIVTRFAWGDNFPPANTLYAGLPASYHYLADLTPAAFVVLGMDPLAALPLHSFVLSILAALCIWAFVRRLAVRPAAATLATTLFLFGAGLGWLVILGTINQSHDLLGTLASNPWDPTAQTALHIRIFNPYLSFLMSQRAYLYGLPVALLTVTLLVRAARRRSLGTFALAGVVAGTLPLAHLPTLLALAMVTPFLVFLLAREPWRLDRIPWVGWIAFHAIWVAVAVPQLLTQLGGGAGALAAFRVEIGWVASEAPFNDPWWWFWLKNIGLFAPLVVLAFFARKALPPRSGRVLLAFMPIFVIANLLVFQPWDWDNHKILVYWLLAAATLCGALLSRVWRDHRSATVRFLIAGAVVSMVAGPVLQNLGQLEGYGHFRMLTTEQMDIAAQIRAVTDPKAIIVGGMEPQDPVAMLSGRQVVMGYWGQLWASGVPYQERQADVYAIYALGPTADALIRKYHVGYVVIGPDELASPISANGDAYAARFPVVAATDTYRVYDVRSVAGG